MPPLQCEHSYKTTCSFAWDGLWLQNHFLSRKGPQHGYTLGPRANSEISDLKHWVRLAVKVTGCFLSNACCYGEFEGCAVRDNSQMSSWNMCSCTFHMWPWKLIESLSLVLFSLHVNQNDLCFSSGSGGFQASIFPSLGFIRKFFFFFFFCRRELESTGA